LTFTPAADQSGTAVITVTVTDDGGSAHGGIDSVTRTFTVTVLPDVTSGFDLSQTNRAGIVDDPANPGQMALLVVGTSGNDTLRVERKSNTQIRVKQGRTVLGTFATSELGRIVIFGLAGNDLLVVDSRITKNAELHGDAGKDLLHGGSGSDALFGEDGNDILKGGKANDRLHGGAGNDHLEGGSGNDHLHGDSGADKILGDSGSDLVLGGLDNDRLYGGRGRDLFIGGLGADRLEGQDDDDLLIGGTTAHDSDEVALLAILAEWTSSRDYAARMANILAASGPALAGTGIFLQPGVSVDDDGARDELFGNSGKDWFFASLSQDKLSRARGELVQ
jgi:Ca2+-binding RTX toxin-like protein